LAFYVLPITYFIHPTDKNVYPWSTALYKRGRSKNSRFAEYQVCKPYISNGLHFYPSDKSVYLWPTVLYKRGWYRKNIRLSYAKATLANGQAQIKIALGLPPP